MIKLSDVLAIVDPLCSGRQQCEFIVGGAEFSDIDPCDDRKVYLQAGYTCVKGGAERNF